MSKVDEILRECPGDSPTMQAFKRGYRKGHFGLAAILRRNSVSRWQQVLDEVAPEPEDAVYEEDEYCAKCLSTADLGAWRGPDDGDSEDAGMMVCQSCWDDQEGFKQWFLEQMMDYLDNSGEYVKLPNGQYRRKETPNEQ